MDSLVSPRSLVRSIQLRRTLMSISVLTTQLTSSRPSSPSTLARESQSSPLLTSLRTILLLVFRSRLIPPSPLVKTWLKLVISEFNGESLPAHSLAWSTPQRRPLWELTLTPNLLLRSNQLSRKKNLNQFLLLKINKPHPVLRLLKKLASKRKMDKSKHHPQVQSSLWTLAASTFTSFTLSTTNRPSVLSSSTLPAQSRLVADSDSLKSTTKRPQVRSRSTAMETWMVLLSTNWTAKSLPPLALVSTFIQLFPIKTPDNSPSALVSTSRSEKANLLHYEVSLRSKNLIEK